jgi:hypothetical protein
VQIPVDLVPQQALAALLTLLIRGNRREILRLRVPAGNRKGAISGSKKSQDAALRMTSGGVGRDFGAGFSANIRDVTLVVNINQHLFTYRFIRMNLILEDFWGIVRMKGKE